jgi:putative tricarboxylic transport membrane protein
MQALVKSAPFAVLLCAALYLFTVTLQFDFPRAAGRLGPDAWPQATLILLMIACVAGIVRNLLAADRSEPPPQIGTDRAARPGDMQTSDPEVPSRYGLVATGFLLFLGYPLALEYAGFLIATFLLMALFMLVGQWRNLLGVAAVSIVGTLALFYVFRGIVYVSLPLGRGPFQDATAWVASLLGMR